VFISGDQSDDDYNEFIREMPWLSVPYDEDFCQSIYEKYAINSIPSLLVIDKNGKIVCKDGRERVSADGKDFLAKLP
jgi:nucleoredoxin